MKKKDKKILKIKEEYLLYKVVKKEKKTWTATCPALANNQYSYNINNKK